MQRNRKAFTLVELLVVIGIIAVLIGILLPALARAREEANTVKCSSNLRGIGQAFEQYLTENQNTFPPSNYYTGLTVNIGADTQGPPQPTVGYTHWSALINGASKWEAASDYLTNCLNGGGTPSLSAAALAPFLNTAAWGQFQCPSLENGGLPPANTYPGNNDLGTPDEATIPNVIDIQAPRLAYSVNEALCPRSYLVAHVPGLTPTNLRGYSFVRSGQVAHSADTILATELWGFQDFALTNNKVTGGLPQVSNSRRPVTGFISFGVTGDSLYNSLTGIYTPVSSVMSELTPDPVTTFNQEIAINQQLTSPNCSLDFVGRNHGQRKLGRVDGDTRPGWDLRLTNFLYVDGHVETKNVADTVYPKFQWGDQMYTLQPN
jgi:prepilin-type N-terminal cleavage/methylation domain-containing protein/prepilin-type processing-associated H-X9-DG protein